MALQLISHSEQAVTAHRAVQDSVDLAFQAEGELCMVFRVGDAPL